MCSVRVNIYICGYFSNIGNNWVGAGFLPKPEPSLGFFFLNPNPIIFFIGPGKTQPIRIGLDRISAGRAKIVIPNILNTL